MINWERHAEEERRARLKTLGKYLSFFDLVQGWPGLRASVVVTLAHFFAIANAGCCIFNWVVHLVVKSIYWVVPFILSFLCLSQRDVTLCKGFYHLPDRVSYVGLAFWMQVDSIRAIIVKVQYNHVTAIISTGITFPVLFGSALFCVQHIFSDPFWLDMCVTCAGHLFGQPLSFGAVLGSCRM